MKKDNKKKTNKNNKYKWLLVLLLLILISTGYAALSRTLNINGVTNIEKANWQIVFQNIKETDGSVTATTPTYITNDTNINYEIVLRSVGDFYEFTVDVKNTGTIDAKLGSEPLLNGVSEKQKEYLDYDVTYADGTKINVGDTLKSGQTKTIKVRIEYGRTITDVSKLPKDSETLSLTYQMNYIQE